MKSYVSVLGYDYTKFVNSEEDINIFLRICECEEKCKGVPLKDCIEYVVEAANLDAKLRKVDRKVILQNDPKLN